MHFRTNQGTTSTFGIGRIAAGITPNATGPPFVFTAPISPGTRSIVISISGGAGNSTVTVTGVQSGIEWTQFVSNGSDFGAFSVLNPIPTTIMPLVQIVPVYGAIDSSVSISMVLGFPNCKFSVIESSQDVMLGSPEQPIGVMDVYGPCSTITAQAAGGAIVSVLPAPPSHYMNEIHSAMITAATTTFVATAFMRLQGTPSGVQIIGTFQQATAAVAMYQGTPLRVTEQINLSNGTNVTANAHIYYRQIPIPRGQY